MFSTDTQVKVRDATSNDPWGPSGTQMNELAQLSYNQSVCAGQGEVCEVYVLTVALLRFYLPPLAETTLSK